MLHLKSALAAGAIVVGSSVSIYTGTQTDPNIVVFNFDGSASMKPIIEFLMNKYAAKKNNKKVVFNISTVGSNSGLKKLLNGTSEFALVSHDISSYPKNETYKNDWGTKKLKTITLATEAMVVLYKPPKECSKELILSEDNIKKLYSLFSGFNAPDISAPIKFSDLLDDTDNENCKVDVHAWVKSTGPVKSGTSKAFVDNPLFKGKCVNSSSGTESAKCNQECNEWCQKVIGGYGGEYKLNYVPEPTNLHWDSFKHNLKEGSMTYLPSSFVLQNWDEISSLNIKFAKYKKSDSLIIEFTKDLNGVSKQEWTRSYNLVYSTSDISSKQDKKDLLEFLVNHSCELSVLQLLAKPYCAKDTSGCNSSSGSPEQIDVSEADKTT